MLLFTAGFLTIFGVILPYICIVGLLCIISMALGLKSEADWECNQPKKEDKS
jgi:hypothetical protein